MATLSRPKRNIVRSGRLRMDPASSRAAVERLRHPAPGHRTVELRQVEGRATAVIGEQGRFAEVDLGTDHKCVLRNRVLANVAGPTPITAHVVASIFGKEAEGRVPQPMFDARA